MRFPAWVRRWPPLWSPALLIQRLSDLVGISRRGLDSCRSKTRAGGKDRLGSISKQGDCYLRSLFTAGALAQLTTVIVNPGHHDAPWSHWACPAARNPQLAHRVVFNPMASIWNKLFTGEAGDGVPPVTSVGPEWNRTEKKFSGRGRGKFLGWSKGSRRARAPDFRFVYACVKTQKRAKVRVSRIFCDLRRHCRGS
jgi:hypothetical protein